MARPPSKRLRTLDELRERCTIDPATGCWTWTGRKWADGYPALYVVGETGNATLQVGLAVLATGKRLPAGRAYIPTCGNFCCANLEHRREGTRGELQKLIGATRKPLAFNADTRAKISEGLRKAWEARREAMPAKPKPEPKPPKVRAVKPPKPAAGPKLHDPLDSMGARRGVPMTGLRKPGSNARPVPMQRPAPTEPRITADTRVTVAPACTDQRYTVRELPPGYVSTLDPREARPWAQAAAGSRAA